MESNMTQMNVRLETTLKIKGCRTSHAAIHLHRLQKALDACRQTAP